MATSTASTSSSSTFSFVLKSVSSTRTGFTPGTPAAQQAWTSTCEPLSHTTAALYPL